MSISIDQLPQIAASASTQLRDELTGIFGSDLIGVWLHGGTTFRDRSRRLGDLDICVVIAHAAPNERDPDRWRNDPASRPRRFDDAQGAIATDQGVRFDAMCLVAGELQENQPAEAFRDRPHADFPIYCAHWLAGQYVHLHGELPEKLIRAPEWSEIVHALDRELEHLERHVYEGDAADPYEATYAMFNSCRILRTLETGDPVISKRSAGKWGLTHLPERWHEPIRAAGRSYDGEASQQDNELLRVSMPAFVEMVREQLPVTAPRLSEVPRWS